MPARSGGGKWRGEARVADEVLDAEFSLFLSAHDATGLSGAQPMPAHMGAMSLMSRRELKSTAYILAGYVAGPLAGITLTTVTVMVLGSLLLRQSLHLRTIYVPGHGYETGLIGLLVMGYLGFGGLSFVFELVFASPMLYLANRYFRRRISLISIGVVGFGLWFLPMLALLLALPRHAPNIPVTGVLSGIVGITGLVSAYVFALVATRPTPAGQV